MQSVVTALNYPHITITFENPDSNGIAISSYQIVFFDYLLNTYRED